jgi:hypothetical protein
LRGEAAEHIERAAITTAQVLILRAADGILDREQHEGRDGVVQPAEDHCSAGQVRSEPDPERIKVP